MFHTLSDDPIYVPTPVSARDYGDPTMDPDYVQGGGSGPTYTPPSQWGHNLDKVPFSAGADPTWVYVALAGVVILAIAFGSHR